MVDNLQQWQFFIILGIFNLNRSEGDDYDRERDNDVRDGFGCDIVLRFVFER